MVIREKFYSAEDLLEMSGSPAYTEMRMYLIEGVLTVMSPAGAKHGGYASKLDRKVGNFVEERQLGYMTAAETGYILFKNPNGKDTVLAPDVGFIAAQRLPDGLPDGYIPFAPDLAIEVVSPTDKPKAIEEKIKQYIKYGTRLLWVFYPKTRTVGVHTPQGATTVDINGTLESRDVLPGFKLAVRDIFGE
jgi:Uma2 family endonuclease